MAIYNGGLSVKNVSVSTTGDGNAITSISADGNVITATKGTTFLTSLPNHNHNYAGSSSIGGPANSVVLANGTADASRFVIFQDSANSTSTLNACYDTDFKYNPVSNLMNVGSVQLNSKVTLQYNSSTESLDFVFA